MIRIRAYAAFLAALALTLAVGSWSVHGLGRWEIVLVLALVAHTAEGRGMRMSPTVEASVSFMPVVLAAVLFGPAAGAVVGVVSMMRPALHRDAPLERLVIYISGKAVSGCSAGWAAIAAERALGGASLGQLVGVAAAASVAGTAAEFLVTALTLLLRHGTRPGEVWRLVRGSLAVSAALYAPVTALIAFVYPLAGVEVLAFFAVPLVASHLSFAMHARQAQLIEELGETNSRLERANDHLRRVNISFAAAMVRALDSRDAYTADHSAAVAIYSRDIARRLGMTGEEIERIHLTALVHDIGKIGVRAEVLEKRSALNDDEWAEMRSHSEIGAQILAEVEDYHDVALVVRSHHERWDGAGYPDGLAGSAIPLLARIIAVADSYNAMTSNRPYRSAMTPERAVQQLTLGKGSQSQPELVDAFLEVLERETDQYRRGALANFTAEAVRHGVLGADDLVEPGPAWGAAVA